MNAQSLRKLTLTIACAGLLGWACPSLAFRMIQVSGTGRVTGGTAVSCDDYGEFAHWSNVTVSWYLNPSLQGSDKTAAIQAATNSWNGVTGASHVAFLVGTTTDSFATDGRNTMVWQSGGSCTGGCLGLTALVVQSGQVIVESDITFNNDVAWHTNGSDYDTQAVVTHELGHTFGIHHTDLTSSPQPTMFATYFGTGGRSLESDDQQALQCSEQWYVSPSWEGYHDSTNCQAIKGWVWNSQRPNSTMLVDLYDGSTFLTQAGAFECRQDLVNAGKGNGCHGFNVSPYGTALAVLRNGQYHTINVRNHRTGANLTGTGQSIICQVSGFTNQTPAEYNDTLGSSWSVGNVFTSSIAGRVTDLRYYKAAEETGTHTLKMWTNSGSFLGSVDVNFGSGAGWVTGHLSWPGIAIQANTQYVVTVTTTTKQTKTSCGLSSPITNGPLSMVGGRWVQGNGIFPTNTSCSNYWTDVLFDQ
jgi:hypothetical protein